MRLWLVFGGVAGSGVLVKLRGPLVSKRAIGELIDLWQFVA